MTKATAPEPMVNEAKLFFRILIKDGIVNDMDHIEGGLNWIPNIKFILTCGECSCNKIESNRKYLMLSSDHQ